MGNEHNKVPGDMSKSKQKEAAALPDAMNIKKYTKIGVIGRGGFGKVNNTRCRCGKFKIRKIESSTP